MNIVKNEYSLSDKIRLGWYLLRTKLIDRRVRLFRYPIVIRGRKYIDFGEGLTTGIGCRFDCYAGNKSDEVKIRFGKNVQINDYVHMVGMESISIGSNVLLASHVFISDNSHGSYAGDEQDSSPDIPPTERKYSTAPVKIGDNCWIGEGVIIMPGVEIGYGCIIGAHSVVNSNIPDRTIAVGAPARVVKIWDSVKKHWVSV